jgi:hypothetical protein
MIENCRSASVRRIRAESCSTAFRGCSEAIRQDLAEEEKTGGKKIVNIG